MDERFFRLLACLFGFAAVAAGAFGAHALKHKLSAEMLAVFETAARYQLIHAVLLYAVAAASPGRFLPAVLLTAGIVIFSGSLYLLVFTEVKKWGMVTRLGGLLLLAGWLALFIESLNIPAKT